MMLVLNSLAFVIYAAVKFNSIFGADLLMVGIFLGENATSLMLLMLAKKYGKITSIAQVIIS